MSRAYAYVRVSTDRQADSTLGIRGYVQSSVRYADAYDLDLGRDTVWTRGDSDKVATRERVLIDAGVSAYKKRLADRKIGRELCRSVEPGDVVIIPCFWRGFRNIADCLDTTRRWDAIGVRYVMLDCPVQGEAMRGLFAAIGQWESEARSVRIKEAHRVSRAEGRPIGNRDPDPGFTWKRVGNQRGVRRYMVPCPVELALIGRVRQWMNQRLGREQIWSKIFNEKIRTPNWGKGHKEYSLDRVKGLMEAVRKIDVVEQRTGKTLAQGMDDPKWWEAYREYDLEKRAKIEKRRTELRQRKEWHRYQLEMGATS